MADISDITDGYLSLNQIQQALIEGTLSRRKAAHLLADNVQHSLARLSGTERPAGFAYHSVSPIAATLLQPLGINGGDLRVLEVNTLDTLPLSEQYDLVVIVGFHETFASDTDVIDPLGHLLRRAYSALAPDGSIVIAGHNALALRHFNDQQDTYGRDGAASVEGRFPTGSPKLWSTAAIRDTLVTIGFQDLEPCALMGSVARPRLLVSPKGCKLPAERWNLDTLIRRVFSGNAFVQPCRFSESRVLSEIIQNGSLTDWSDGYVFLAHKSKEHRASIEGWLASAFSLKGSNALAHETRFMTEATNDDNSGDIHVETYTENTAEPYSVAPYINGTIYRDKLDDLLQTPGWTFEQVLQWSAVWLRCLLTSLEASSASRRDGTHADAYAGNCAPWVPDWLFLATPARWVQRLDGSFQCLREKTGSEETAPLAAIIYTGLLSTFGTLHSIAEPADARWLNPAALANSVVSRLGHALDEADQKALVTHWQHVTGKAFPTPTHFSVRQKPYSQTDEAKLYWATASEGFSETKTSTAPLAFDGTHQTLRLPIGTPDQTVTALRFDVANRPGCFEIENMAVLQANSEVLWRWDHTREALSGVKGATLVVDQAAGRSCVISQGNDPQLALNLPEPALSTGGMLEVCLSARPLRL